ncbi:hypothetical protein HON49_03720 [archaeon]|nr:hypothetical protein [archaeon]
MKKRGQVISFYDIMGLLIFALVMLFWIMVLSPPKRQAVEIREQIHYFDDEDMLMAILKTPIGENTVLDHIFLEDYETVNRMINESLYPVFGPACFELIVNGAKFTELHCKKILTEELLKSEIYVPKDKEGSILIKLNVPGYTNE